MDEHQQIVDEFLVEATETLDHLDQDLIALEIDPTNNNTINKIFRAVHTLKGTCGFLGFSKLESITHVGESLLDGARAGRLSIDEAITTALLKLTDATRRILQNIETHGSEGHEDYSGLRDELARLCSGVKSGVPAPIVLSEVVDEVEEVATEYQEPLDEITEPLEDAPASPVSPAPEEDLDALFWAVKEESAQANQPSPEKVISVETVKVQEIVKEVPLTTSPSAPPLEPEKKGSIEGPPLDEEKKSALTDSSLRVDVALLDQLMNLVGELVLARNQILQFTKTQGNSDFISTSQRLNLITSELQEQVMKTRMQPIANVWNKFPRVVRDVAHQCGKQVRIEMQGKETDLDKTIIEAIKDPLTHIVRNSVDHGIEKPEVRIANGKNPEGCLLLRAFHEGGHVIIEIADDGAGLNTDRIKAKAIERGLVTVEKASRMSEKEINSLIFLPGFSTAEQVTNLSGRGVGMDVVRSNIEKIGGSTDLSSRLGKGTTLRIKIPLTLAIVPALLVSTGAERFAIPQVNLVELVRVDGENIKRHIESIHGARFYRLRGNLLPLVYLSEELKIADGESGDRDKINIVVVKADERSFGIVVDVIHDTEEIVVKPLGKQLKQLSVFAGATIMGDGRIALILDVLGIARKARVLSESTRRAMEKSQVASESVEQRVRESLLIVQSGKCARAAVPLSAVQRLEEFPLSAIEQAGGVEVVQYRGGILPLIDLSLLLTGEPSINDDSAALRQVVVYARGTTVCGFVVSRIVDIVEDSVKLQLGSSRPGIKGSAIIQKQVTEMLDLDSFVGAMPLLVSESVTQETNV